MARNEYVGRCVGAALGRLEEVDVDLGEVECGEYIRIIVALDMTKPLLCRKKLNIGLLEPVWLSFSYERLHDFCFCCGLLGHR